MLGIEIFSGNERINIIKSEKVQFYSNRDSEIFRKSIVRKPKNVNFQRIPRVPFSNRGKEHNDARDWHFDQSRSRVAG